MNSSSHICPPDASLTELSPQILKLVLKENSQMRCFLVSPQPLLWHLVPDGSEGEDSNPRLWARLENPSPNLAAAGSPDPQSKRDHLCCGSKNTGCAVSFRVLGDGKELTVSAMSSLCSLAPQCSLHLILRKHQQIKEACPEIVIWMNVTFVGQRGKLGS